MNQTLLRSSILILALTPSLIAGDWPGWRGPNQNGVSADKNLPTKWSTNDNVRWRVALPERGNSSPVVWGDRVVAYHSRRSLLLLFRTGRKVAPYRRQ